MVARSARYSGSIPENYDRYLGPAWFGPFATDLAGRLPRNPPGAVLELACGTGIATRRLRERLDPAVRLVASDVSEAMLDFARRSLTDCRGIEWRQADAASLPFGDGEFGAVVCAFGIMFVPDKRQAMKEARRVLRRGGILLFSIWDRIEHNPHAAASAELMERLFPGDRDLPVRAIYEMHDPALLRGLLAGARFDDVRIEPRQIQLEGVSARSIATGLIRGSPRLLLIQEHGASPDEVIDRLSDALAKAGGTDPYRGPATAVMVEARAAG